MSIIKILSKFIDERYIELNKNWTREQLAIAESLGVSLNTLDGQEIVEDIMEQGNYIFVPVTDEIALGTYMYNIYSNDVSFMEENFSVRCFIEDILDKKLYSTNKSDEDKLIKFVSEFPTVVTHDRIFVNFFEREEYYQAIEKAMDVLEDLNDLDQLSKPMGEYIYSSTDFGFKYYSYGYIKPGSREYL